MRALKGDLTGPNPNGQRSESSLSKSGVRAHYDCRRDAGDRHTAAQRNLFNRFMGMLFFCLQHHQPYDELKAFPHQIPAEVPAQAA